MAGAEHEVQGRRYIPSPLPGAPARHILTGFEEVRCDIFSSKLVKRLYPDRMLRLTIGSVLLCASCATSTPKSVVNAVGDVALGIAEGSAVTSTAQAVPGEAAKADPARAHPGESRASPACYPPCGDGMRCSESTRCVAIPCMGRCRIDQVCDTTGMIEACVPANSAKP